MNLTDIIKEAVISNKGRALFLKETMYLVVHKGADWVVDSIHSDRESANRTIPKGPDGKRYKDGYKIVEAKISSMPKDG